MLEWLLLWASVGDGAPRHPTRVLILSIVDACPGITLTTLRESVGCSWGTIQHHTRALERRGALRSEPVGRTRRFFTDTTPAGDRRGVALVRSGRVRELVEAIARRPGQMQRDLTEGLRLSRKVLRNYMDELVAQSLVVEERHARARTYHPTQALQALLDELRDDRVELSVVARAQAGVA